MGPVLSGYMSEGVSSDIAHVMIGDTSRVLNSGIARVLSGDVCPASKR